MWSRSEGGDQIGWFSAKMATGGGGEGGSGVESDGIDSDKGQGENGASLDPTRQKGFTPSRLETQTLGEMRLKQRAIVARFMTFLQRKNSLVIEMYEPAFYRQKPTMDKILILSILICAIRLS